MYETLFDPLIERLQENASQKSNRISGTKIEWSLPDSIDRFLQQPAHVTYTLQRNFREIAIWGIPMTVFLPSLPAKLGKFLGMRMKEAQPSFHGGRLAHTSSLRLSLALLPAPLLQAFLRLKAHGGTLRHRLQSSGRLGCETFSRVTTSVPMSNLRSL
jgi:hypothetical protein